jgi:hypothetical protein
MNKNIESLKIMGLIVGMGLLFSIAAVGVAYLFGEIVTLIGMLVVIFLLVRYGLK